MKDDYLQGFIDQFEDDHELQELSNKDWSVSQFLKWLKTNKFKIIKQNNIMVNIVTKEDFHKFIEEELEFIIYDTLIDEDDNLVADNLYDVLTSKYNLTLK